MKKNTKTCNLCGKRENCRSLCNDMKKIIKNKKIIMIFILMLHSMHVK